MATTYTAPVENGKLVTDYQAKKKAEEADKNSGSSLGYDQFLTLLCAEMQYQDPLEPTSNTEYVAQLATFSQLEATLSMQQTQENEMANALVGKQVILKVADETTGKENYVNGKVDYIMYQEDGSVMLSVNNRLYNIDTLDTVADADYYEAVTTAKTFSDMVGQLPDIENINENYEKAIQQIRVVYDGMTSYQQKYVDSDDLTKLENYEKRLAEIKKAHEGESSEKTDTDNTTDNTENGTTDVVDKTDTDNDANTDNNTNADSKTETEANA